MNYVITVVTAALLAALFYVYPVKSQEIQTGRGLICDTVEQIEQFLDNIRKYNAPIEVEHCAVVPVVFTRDEKVKEVEVKGKPYSIEKITVYGVAREDGIIQVPPTPVYSIFPIKREEALRI